MENCRQLALRYDFVDRKELEAIYNASLNQLTAARRVSMVGWLIEPLSVVSFASIEAARQVAGGERRGSTNSPLLGFYCGIPSAAAGPAWETPLIWT
jgi:hypothetical protein